MKKSHIIPITIVPIVVISIMIIPFFSPYEEQVKKEYFCNDWHGCPDYDKLKATCENSLTTQTRLGPEDSPTGIYIVTNITRVNNFCNIVTIEQSRDESGILERSEVLSTCDVPIVNTYWPRIFGFELDISQYCK